MSDMRERRWLLARLAAGEVEGAPLETAVATLAAAGRPVPLPGLCNALWFERGSAGGYDGPAFIEFLNGVGTFAHGLPTGREPLEPQPAVPLGALVTVEVGNDIAYGEVIWREGAHPLVGEPWVPGWLAGAPSGVPLDTAPPVDFAVPPGPHVLRERLVVDFDILGAALAPTEVRLARLRAHERRLDRFGHLVADVVYPDGLDEADEVTFWAAWCAATHAAALAAAGLPADAGLLAEAASVLAAALDAREDVRSFGPYYMHADHYAAVIAADARDAGALPRVVRGLAQLPSHGHVGWAAMSARLVDTLGSEAMIGIRWPTGVVSASLLALDTLAAEAPDGDWGGVDLRLDDAWQGGGLWRAERLDAAAPVAADPGLALGLGWVEHTGGGITRRDRAEDVEMAAAPEWYDESDELDWDLTGSEASWLVHLSGGDIDTDRLRLPPSISDMVVATLEASGQGQLFVVLDHAGVGQTRSFSGLGEDGHLCVAWPLGILPGTSVRMSWPVGTTVVRAATTLLGEPEEVAGITYNHAFNRALALAAAGQSDGATRTVTIGQLIRAAVRRHGAVTEDGCLGLSIDEVVRHCFGPEGELTPGYGLFVLRRAVVAAAAGMAATGAVRLDGEVIVVSPRFTAAGRRADAELLARFIDATGQRLRRTAQRHWVPPTIVNLPGHWRRSAAKDEQWPDVAGTDGLPMGPLADHQTWRRGHARGGAVSPEVIAAVERARRVLARLGNDGAADQFSRIATDPYATTDLTAVPAPAEAL